jgi:hypothetical protein
MKQVAFCFFVLAIAGVATNAAAKVTHKVYLTAKEKNGIPDTTSQTEFKCSDKIYAVLEISGLSKTKHELEAVWTDPKGEKRERTNVPLFVSMDKTRSWVWLRLHQAAGAAVMTAFDPAYSMDKFIGKWTISIYIDKKLVDKKPFSVLC